MPRLQADTLVARVASALAEPDAEYALSEALVVLATAGIVARSQAEGTPWIEVQHGGRRVALDAAVPHDEQTRRTLASQLTSAVFRIRADEELRRIRERMDMLSAASFEGIFIHVDGKVIDANRRFAEMLGYEGNEVLGPDTMRACVAPEDMPGVLERMRTHFEGSYVITAVRKDGSRFRAELQSKQGKLAERVVAVRDVTERERTAELLRASEGRLQDLADQRAADLTAHLLAYAGRPDLGRRDPVELGTLWRELSTVLETRLSRTARLELKLAPGCVVLGDAAALTRVLMNLLTNASDALGERAGTIVVTTSRVLEPDARWDVALGAAVGPGDWVQLEVTDTGFGTDSRTLLRTFEPFVSTNEQAHGLGLASCLGIVSAHGGALSVESEVGRGTRFSVLLPSAGELPRSEAPRARVSASNGPRKILVIDDESVVRALLRRSLEKRGYSVSEAPDGESGIRAVGAMKPDLIVLDMLMPDIDGAEVVSRLRADGFTLPIVIASGHLDSSMGRRLSRGSFQGFLLKPFTVAELMSAIEAAFLPTSRRTSHPPNRN